MHVQLLIDRILSERSREAGSGQVEWPATESQTEGMLGVPLDLGACERGSPRCSVSRVASSFT